MLVYCCLKWIYRHGGARAQRRCKSLPRGWHERGGGLPPGQGVPASPGGCGAGFPVGPYGAHPGTAVPSPSHSPARRNENKMVIMLQSSSGKGSEADEKPYLRVRPLLLITRSEAVNSADTAITGSEPGPVLGPRLPGHGMGTGERGWAAARLRRVRSLWGSVAGGGKTSWQTPAPSGLAGTISWLFWEGRSCAGEDLEHRSSPSGTGGG